MKKTNLLVLSAAAALLATSCSKNQLSEANPGEPIQFKAFVGAASKVAESTTDNVASFAVTAFLGSTTPGAVYFSDTYDKQSGDGTTSWVTSSNQPYYWPTSGGLTFLGYSPKDISSVFKSQPTVDLSSVDAAKITGVAPKTRATEQTDLLMFRNSGTSGSVPLVMQHPLSQIVIKAKNSNTTNMKVEVAGVKITNAKGQGDVTWMTGNVSEGAAPMGAARWTQTEGSETSYLAGGQTETTPVQLTDNADAVDIMFSEGGFMLIPQQLTAWNQTAQDLTGAYIAVLCRVSQKNGTGWTQVYPTTPDTFGYAAVGIGTNWEPGKKYTYTLNFFGNGGGGGIEPPTDPEEPVVPAPDPENPGQPIVGGPISFTVAVNAWQAGTTETPNMPASSN